MFRQTITALSCASLLLVFLSTSTVRAVDREWIGTGTLLGYDVAANWSPLGAPTSLDDLTFAIDVGGTPIVVGATSTANSLTFTDNNWELTGFAGGILDNDTDVVIDDATGTSFATGTRVLLSDNLIWMNVDDAFVGQAGFGELVLEDNSDFTARRLFVGNTETGNGSVTLTGLGTTLTASANGFNAANTNSGLHQVGINGGTGTVNVLDGARLLTTPTIGNDIYIGSGVFDADPVDPNNPVVPSLGTLNVDGVGSLVETEDLMIGRNGGIGILNVTGGGAVDVGDGGTAGSPQVFFAIGADSNGTGLVTGDASLLEGRLIYVGTDGTSELEVADGGIARTIRQSGSTNEADFNIGLNLGSDGKMAVHGTRTDGTTPSLLDVDDNLIVGNSGQGVLNVGLDLDENEVGSGAVVVDGRVWIGRQADNPNDNRLVVSGADASLTAGDIRMADGGTGNATNTLEARNGATITTDALDVGFSSGGNAIVILDGSGTTLNAGYLFMGNGSGGGATGMMTVSNGAVASFSRDGSIDDGFDAVTISDDGNGQGTLNITGAGSLVQTTNANGGWYIGGSDNENGGHGTVNITAGGQGISAARVNIGHGNGAVGDLNIDGPGSRFEANGDFVLVGFEGLGTLDVTAGGELHVLNQLNVSDEPGSAGSELNITGPGSLVETGWGLVVGKEAAGTLNVTAGGRLNIATDNAASRLIIGDVATTGSDIGDGSMLFISGAGSRVEYQGTGDVTVGNAAGFAAGPRSVLEVTDGGVFTTIQRDGPNNTGNIVSQARIIVGDVNNGHGQVVVDGAGSLVEASTIYVGDGSSNSSGILDVTSGGTVTTTVDVQVGSNGNGVGTVNVDGPTSSLTVGTELSVGDDIPGNGAATGNLNVTAGATVTNGSQAFLGRYTGSFGTATVGSSTTDTSTWSIGSNLIIAGTSTTFATGASLSGSGSGTLNVNAGGLVMVEDVVALKDRGTINLNGGELAAEDYLFQDFAETTRAGVPTVNFNSGTLRYTGDKTLAASDLNFIFTGGENSLTAGQHLAINGNATFIDPLRVNGGTLSLGFTTPASMGQVDFDAGTLNITGNGFVVTSTGLFGPSLVIDDDQSVNTTQMNVNADGIVNITRGAFSANIVFNSGTIIVAEGTADFLSTGLINNGDLVLVDATTTGTITNNGHIEIINSVSSGALNLQAGSSLGMDVDSLTDFDQLTINGDLSLGGMLDLDINSGLTLTVGDSFELIEAAGDLTGEFANFADGASVGVFGGMSLFIDYDYVNDLVALVTSTDLLADTEPDGDVDGADFLTLQRSNPSLIPAWQTEYGSTTSLASSQSVPEPTSLLLLLTMLLLHSSRSPNRKGYPA